MRIHEYQAKQILQDFGVPVPPGKVATDPDEAREVFDALPGDTAVVKAQSYGFTPEGGRGVGRARSADDAAALARQMIGQRFGSDPFLARPVTKVLLEQYVEPQASLYLALLMDPKLAKPVMLAATNIPRREPGTVATDGVTREVIDPRFGTLAFQWRKITAALGLPRSMLDAVTAVTSGLYRAFIECECIEAEIGRLGLAADRELVALEARMRFDRNALFRHHEIAGLRDPAEFSDTENVLSSNWMTYVALGGRVGCLVSDTGSALVLLDELARVGARPGGIVYVTGHEPAEKIAHGVRSLLREESFRTLVVELPRRPAAAERVVSAVRMALSDTEARKPTVAVAVSRTALDAAEALGRVPPAVRVVRSYAQAADLVGED